MLRASALLGLLLLGVIVLGHDGRRVLQLLALALPLLAWLAWPLRSAGAHRLRAGLVWLLAMGFVADGVVRAYLLDTYQAAPDASFVLSAAANTTRRESLEYLAMHWRAALVWGAAVLAVGLLLARVVLAGPRQPGAVPRALVVLLCGLLLVGGVAHLSKPWRRLQPVLFWAHWAQSVQGLRDSWADQQQAREVLHNRARAAAPVLAQAGPSTVVLVITDSINRDNMALYGYRRATTPRLLDHKAQLQQQMLVMRHAWSVDASTLPSLRNLFHFGEPQATDSQHLLALARAAGYKVWWMSNHDDVGIEQQHARMAEVVDIVNRVPGRASASLDGELLDCVQEALEDPAERKLIVVHLMGAHPHYGLRYPVGANPFDDHIDDVEQGLAQQGRSARVRKFRQDYDAALLYHDFVVSETLQLTRRIGPAHGYRAWMYLSDHGQEVGHGGNHAGHSPSTASGYRIPALLWRNQAPRELPEGVENRPFRADWAGWTLAELLHLQWSGQRPERNALDPAYAWEAPVLPVAVRSFVD